MRFILKLLLFLLPLPFVASQYVLLSHYADYSYLLKHLLVIIVLLVAFLSHIPFKRIGKFRPYFFISFMIFGSYLVTNYFLKSDIYLTGSLYITSFFVLFIYAFLIGRLKNSHRLLSFTYFGLLFLLIVTITVSIFFDINLYSFWGMVDSNDIRKRWTFGYYHPGYFASFVMVCGIFAHVLIKQRAINSWNYLVVLLSTILIYMSGTRNSFISFLIFLSVSHSKFTFRLLKAGFLFGVSIVSIMLYFKWDLINALSTGRLSTWLSHLIYNSDSFSLLFGTGLGNAKRINFASNGGGESSHELVFHIDNFYFEIFLQFGLIGVVLMTLVIASLFVLIVKVRFSGYSQRVLYAVLVTLLFFGLFDSAFISTGNLVPVLLWPLFFIQLNSKGSMKFQEG